jgi:hypothetical protein
MVQGGAWCREGHDAGRGVVQEGAFETTHLAQGMRLVQGYSGWLNLAYF